MNGGLFGISGALVLAVALVIAAVGIMVWLLIRDVRKFKQSMDRAFAKSPIMAIIALVVAAVIVVATLRTSTKVSTSPWATPVEQLSLDKGMQEVWAEFGDMPTPKTKDFIARTLAGNTDAEEIEAFVRMYCQYYAQPFRGDSTFRADFIEDLRSRGKVPDPVWREYLRMCFRPQVVRHPAIETGDPLGMSLQLSMPCGTRNPLRDGGDDLILERSTVSFGEREVVLVNDQSLKQVGKLVPMAMGFGPRWFVMNMESIASDMALAERLRVTEAAGAYPIVVETRVRVREGSSLATKLAQWQGLAEPVLAWDGELSDSLQVMARGELLSEEVGQPGEGAMWNFASLYNARCELVAQALPQGGDDAVAVQIIEKFPNYKLPEPASILAFSVFVPVVSGENVTEVYVGSTSFPSGWNYGRNGRPAVLRIPRSVWERALGSQENTVQLMLRGGRDALALTREADQRSAYKGELKVTIPVQAAAKDPEKPAGK